MPSRHSDEAAGEFHALTDCEGVELDSNVPFRFACCDCGLVHDMVIVSQDDKPVGFAIKRMPEATRDRRAALESASVADERAAFTAWLKTQRDPDDMNKAEMVAAWEAWQARAELGNKERP